MTIPPIFLVSPAFAMAASAAPSRPNVLFIAIDDQNDWIPADWDDTAYRGQNGYLPHPRPRAAYAAMISDLDGQVGRVLAALDAADIAGRTLVAFSSDNGPTHDGRSDPRFHVGGADPKFFGSTGGLRGDKGSV